MLNRAWHRIFEKECGASLFRSCRIEYILSAFSQGRESGLSPCRTTQLATPFCLIRARRKLSLAQTTARSRGKLATNFRSPLIAISSCLDCNGSRVTEQTVYGAAHPPFPQNRIFYGRSFRAPVSPFNSTDIERDEITGHEQSYKQSWQCRVGDLEAVTVPAGTFETYKISCSRYQGTAWQQGYNWYYSPQVGHYVKRIFTWFSKPCREIACCIRSRASESPGGAAKTLRDLVQTALEKNRSDQPRFAEFSAENLRITVVPKRTFRMPNGTYCREYEQKLTARSRTSTQTGVACRDNAGIWRSN